MNARWRWLLAIAGLLLANVIAMVTLAVAANHGSAQVIPDYYAKATHYDDELDRSTRSQALGWRIDIADASDAIEATVVDASGAPITGASVRLTGYQRAHASELVDIALIATSAGHYRGVMPKRRGWYDLVARIEAHGAYYTRRIVIEAR
jgi:nitrogen fixation protein FixH